MSFFQKKNKQSKVNQKSFAMTQDHFMQHYGIKARYFLYNSSRLEDIDAFSKDNALNVMIINTQAFSASLKENSKSKESRIIYSERDNFASRLPIDVIRANHPILILDEPTRFIFSQSALREGWDNPNVF